MTTERVSYSELLVDQADSIEQNFAPSPKLRELASLPDEHKQALADAVTLRRLAEQIAWLQKVVNDATVGDGPFSYVSSNPERVRAIVRAAADIASGFSREVVDAASQPPHREAPGVDGKPVQLPNQR